MKDLTIQEVLKVIPIDEELRTELLANYDSYDEAKKFKVTTVAWRGFNQMVELMEAYWKERIMAEIASGTRQPTLPVQEEIQKEIDREIEDRLSGKQVEKKQIDDIRSKLAELVKTE